MNAARTAISVFDVPIADTDGSGFLDAADAASPFDLAGGARLRLRDTDRRTSVYVCSSAPFELRAIADRGASRGELAAQVPLSRIGFEAGARASGQDEGVSFGNLATLAGFDAAPEIRSLGDLEFAPATVARFGATRAGDAVQLLDQCVRFDARYGLDEGLDLAAGTGTLAPRVEFRVHAP